MAHRDTSVSELCREFGIRPVTLYRYVGPQADVDEELVDQAKLTAWLAVGGRRIGLGDWRPEKSGVFGRFDVESVTELAAPAVKPSGRSFGGTRRRPAATRRECAMTETDAEKALYRTLATRCNVRWTCDQEWLDRRHRGLRWRDLQPRTNDGISEFRFRRAVAAN